MAISKNAQKIIDTAGSGALDYINRQGGFGNNLTSGEATRLLTGFNPTITPQQVYSAGNIAQATFNPAPRPNYADPYALREYFMGTPDVVAARNAVTEANKALVTTRQTGRAQQQAIQELPQALNVIRGEQAVAGQQASLSEQAAAENLLAAQSGYESLANEANAKYQIAQRERAKIEDLITQTGAKAGISFADSFETALQKASKYQKKAEKEAKKEKEKDELKKLALASGVSTKGKSSKDIRKALEKRAKKDSDLQDRLNALKVKSAELDVLKSVKSLNGDDLSQKDVLTANVNFITKTLDQAARGEDGFLDPSVWRAAEEKWVDAGGSVTEFRKLFVGKKDKKGKRTSGYINPNDL